MGAIAKMWNDISDFASDIFAFVVIQLSNITLTDIIDILVMGLLLMFVYRFVRGRKAGKLIAGIAIWMLILAIGRLFQLHTISFIFGYIFQAGIIALVILFQPELRDALERVGEEPLRGLKGLSDKDANRDEVWIRDICEAAVDMSRSRTGALIVLEKNAKLDEIARSGIEIDSKISPYLLRNIFFDKSPLHDGAIIIRGGRIHSAGCLLPLSRRSDIDQSLGTRHRAAIGVTEISDALALVVSEETGKISVAMNGQITRDYTTQSLLELLFEHFLNTGKEKATLVGEEIAGGDEKLMETEDVAESKNEEETIGE